MLSKTGWLFVVLAAAAIVGAIFARHEIAQVLHLLGHAQLRWLAVALGLQMVTYAAAAAVWYVALQQTPHQQPISKLVGLALAMLFSNQAVPSVGISGGLVVVSALKRRGVPESVAMSALLLGLITMYIALVICFAVAAVWASSLGRLFPLVLAAGAIFILIAIGVTYVVFQSKRMSEKWKRRLIRMPVVGKAVKSVVSVPTDLIGRTVLVVATAIQLFEIVVDAATLYACLLAVGAPASAIVVFSSYVIAEVGSRVAIAPGGVGTFEAGCVALLHAGRVPFGQALAATLLLRGFTLWLPMVPGLFTAKQALDDD